MIESGLFVCMAHPDIAGVLIDTWGEEHARIFRELIVAAADCGCFLEFNTYGMRKPLKNTASGARWQYPLIPFWQLAAELKAPAVIGIDVHRPSDITASWVEAEKILHGFGMTPANDRMLEAIRKSVQKNPEKGNRNDENNFFDRYAFRRKKSDRISDAAPLC